MADYITEGSIRKKDGVIGSGNRFYRATYRRNRRDTVLFRKKQRKKIQGEKIPHSRKGREKG